MSDDTVLRISCVYQCYLFVVIEAPVCRAVLIKTTISLTEWHENYTCWFLFFFFFFKGVYTCSEGLFKSVSWEVWQHLGYAIKAKLLFILIMINRETELQFQWTQEYKNCHQPNILRVCFFVFFKGIVWCDKMFFFLSFSYILDLCYTCLKFNDITALFMAQWSRYRYMPTHAHRVYDKRWTFFGSE